jgi:hypothetical protein
LISTVRLPILLQFRKPLSNQGMIPESIKLMIKFIIPCLNAVYTGNEGFCLQTVKNDPCCKILIKLTSSREGIRAAEQFEKEDIHCNLTLLFSKA